MLPSLPSCPVSFAYYSRWTSLPHAKLAFTDTDVADFEVQLKRTATILSFQDWFIGTVLEVTSAPPVVTIRHLDDSTGAALFCI